MSFRNLIAPVWCLTALLLPFSAAWAKPAPSDQPTPPSASAFPGQFGYITTRDGTRLSYVAYKPSAKGKFPTVLQYTPYAGGGEEMVAYPHGGAPTGMRWLKAGYAVVIVSVRGTGCSQGAFDMFGPHEGPDGADVIDWIARQPWSDRKIGMIGGSYPGHTQILVAAQKPKYLRAISPSAVTMSSYDHIGAPGGIYNIGFGSRWGVMIQPQASLLGVQPRLKWGDTECQANIATHPSPNHLELSRQHPLQDDWWKARSLGTYAERVTIPAFVSQSWQDHQTQVTGATELYAKLKGPKWLTLTSGGHDWPIIMDSVQDRLVRWMDHWVKGEKNGAEKEDRVSIYWEQEPGFPAAARWMTQYPAWPVPTIQYRPFYMTSDGTLSAADTSVGAVDRPMGYTYGIGAELIGDSAQFSIAPDPTGTLTWTGDAVDQDLTILGSAQVQLFVSSENVDTDFVVSLHDVYPNGDVQYLQRGVLRASMRKIDEARSTREHVYRAYDQPEPLVPGQIYDIRLSLPPVGAVLRRGHRLQVTITSPSSIPQPDWGLLPLNMIGRNQIHSSKTYPTRILVPILPGATAKAAEPACGSMHFQPCRKAAR